MNWYCKFLVRQPYLVVLAIGILSSACLIVSLTTTELPDFSAPTLGFEARGTDISQRLTAWYNLLRETGPTGKLVADPNDLLLQDIHYNVNTIRKHKKGRKNNNLKIKKLKVYSQNGDFHLDSKFNIYVNGTSEGEDHWKYGRNTSSIDDEDKEKRIKLKKIKWNRLKNVYPPSQEYEGETFTDGYFCESPMKEFSHFVVQKIGPNSAESLFGIDSLLAMCDLEQQLQNINGYHDFCQKEISSSKCCRPWSISNYVALLSNKSSCFDVDDEDVISVQNLLLNCFQYFNTLKLSSDCTQTKCMVPTECTKHNAVFNIFNYLADVNFIRNNNSDIFLKYAMIFIPVAKSTKVLPFYYEIEKSELQNEIVKIAAMDLGLKNVLFDECLFSDGWLIGLGGIFVIMCMWLYTSSLSITLMTVIAVVFSLGNAYFIYSLVFEMTFFPFMNLLAVVVIIGIGADDAFIFTKIWQCTVTEHIKSDRTRDVTATTHCSQTSIENLNNIMAVTLKHAALSMFVTSLTTASAFYASVTSSITSIKCFGVFAGTAVMSNYVLMITWIPASISLKERITCRYTFFIAPKIFQTWSKSINRIGSSLENYIIKAVLNLPLLWLLLLGFTGIASGFLVLYWPRLQLPNSPDFHLFVSNHPFELYETKFKNEFWFEKTVSSFYNFNLRFVWGINPVDKGDYFNPRSRGDLYFDNNFNVSSIESQVWLLGFCKRLKKQPFYQLTFGVLLPNCFIENFITYMNRVCIDSMYEVDRSPCCEVSKFPFEPHIFEYCLPQSISSLYATPREYFIPGVAGPKFVSVKRGENGTSIPVVKALVVEYESNFSYTVSYLEARKFVTTVQPWFDKELSTAPEELKGGWFISELDFFDLQDTLSKGTLISIGMAMCTSLLVLLFVTLNVLISLYAVITVTLTILTTVAILILLGWKLNILESVSVSTAIGLAVDFSLHYGIHYRFSSNTDRASSTSFALSRIIAPATMAALTTGAAGVIMLGSKVLPYIQIGVFLVVVMSISWIYSTFFLMSLLSFIGPQYGFMQFSYPTLTKRHKNNNAKSFSERFQSQTVVSEHLLTPSSSAVGDLVNSESHELNSLTSSSFARSTNNDKANKPDYDQVILRSSGSRDYRSPSGGSATTVVLPDDSDAKI